MRVEAHDAFGNLINQEVTRVIVYDDHDNPISITFKYDEKVAETAHIKDPEFQRYLEMLGIEKVVKVSTYVPPGTKHASNNSRSILD